MSKIIEKQLIEQIKTLKDVKPRKEWAVLLKSQILSEKQAEVKFIEQSAKTLGIMDILSFVFAQKKLAYSLATILLLALGVFGVMSYSGYLTKQAAEKDSAALLYSTEAKQNAVDLNNKINDLMVATKSGNVAVNDINTKVSALAKSLKNNSVKDPNTIKQIAKTLADVPGTDLTANYDPDVIDLYQTVVQSQVADLQKTTLTDSQKKILSDAENLYSQEKYEQALEEILPISN